MFYAFHFLRHWLAIRYDLQVPPCLLFFCTVCCCVHRHTEQFLAGHPENLNAHLASQTRSAYCKELLQIYQERIKAKSKQLSAYCWHMCISIMMHSTSVHSLYKERFPSL